MAELADIDDLMFSTISNAKIHFDVLF